MDIQIKGRSPVIRYIYINGVNVGALTKRLPTETHQVQWVGEINVNNETWRIAETNFKDLHERIKEACNVN